MKPVYTMQEIADELDRSRQTIYRWCEDPDNQIGQAIERARIDGVHNTFSGDLLRKNLREIGVTFGGEPIASVNRIDRLEEEMRELRSEMSRWRQALTS